MRGEFGTTCGAPLCEYVEEPIWSTKIRGASKALEGERWAHRTDVQIQLEGLALRICGASDNMSVYCPWRCPATLKSQKEKRILEMTIHLEFWSLSLTLPSYKRDTSTLELSLQNHMKTISKILVLILVCPYPSSNLGMKVH